MDVPTVVAGFAGVTTMEESVADVTVSVVVADTPLEFTIIVVVPAAAAVANPLFEIVAMAVFDDDHDDDIVMSWVVLSE